MISVEVVRLPHGTSISAFFPAYNDAPTIVGLVKTARDTLSSITDDWEIIIVDDCSPDGAGKLADQLAAEDKRIRVIHHEKNRGYGGALRSGFAAATKDWVFYTDSDGQYDVRELPKLVEHIGEADVVNGYKMQRGDRFYRKVIGRIYHHTVRFLFALKMRDVDCDFRLMRRELVQSLELTSNSGVICAEMMTKVHGAGARMVEVPVRHYPRVAGRSQFFRPRRILKLMGGLMVHWVRLMVLGGKNKYAGRFAAARAAQRNIATEAQSTQK